MNEGRFNFVYVGRGLRLKRGPSMHCTYVGEKEFSLLIHFLPLAGSVCLAARVAIHPSILEHSLLLTHSVGDIENGHETGWNGVDQEE